MKADVLKAILERRRNLQIGDLVQCPASINTPSYTGLVIEVAGHKATILGGADIGIESWDGIAGRYTWDMSDLTLLVSA